MLSSVTWKIGGEAGFGIMASGNMLCRAFSRAGYFVFGTNEYPSLIRGGHNLITVRIATEAFYAMNRDVHILVALNKQTVELHKNELSDGSLVMYDPKDAEWKTTDLPARVKLLAVPLTDIVKKSGGENVMRNTVALGATIALLGVDFSLLEVVIRDQFKRKGDEVVVFNLTIAKAGFDQIKSQYGNETSTYIAQGQVKGKQLVMNGSEALGIGAVCGGLKFAAVYPMTPINSVITFLADHAKSLGVVYKQPEDEIAGINMALGASVAGVRSMVATSGGGFALMVEGLALAGMLELPIVIDLGMRVGPATGMPTYTEQGELQFAIHAGHGEFPRIVLAPADAEEAYALTAEAFNFADRFQIPVFVLTDKYLNESQWCVSEGKFRGDIAIDRGMLKKPEDLPTDGSFKRYDLSAPDGISPRTTPGMNNGFFIANSYEHDEFGYVTEDAAKRAAMATKRLKKLGAIQQVIMPPKVYGNEVADISFLTWGSTRGPVLEAMKRCKYLVKGKTANIIHFPWLYPFPIDTTTKLLSKAKRLINVEQNATGQFASLIREHTGIVISEHLLKYDGRPFYPEEILEGVK